jgi:hypothetical protein
MSQLYTKDKGLEKYVVESKVNAQGARCRNFTPQSMNRTLKYYISRDQVHLYKRVLDYYYDCIFYAEARSSEDDKAQWARRSGSGTPVAKPEDHIVADFFYIMDAYCIYFYIATM